MDFMQLIMGRRSIRRYLDKEVSDEILNQILEAVRWSPSWANTQCWELVVVRDKRIKERLQNTVSAKNPGSPAVLAAPLLIAVCGRLKRSGYYKEKARTKFDDWFMFDLGLATQNLCLAAHSLGLGTVIVGMFDHDAAKKILRLPEEHEVVVLMPLGYPDQHPKPPKRRQISDFSYLNSF